MPQWCFPCQTALKGHVHDCRGVVWAEGREVVCACIRCHLDEHPLEQERDTES